MAGIFSWLGAKGGATELPNIYPFPTIEKDFICIDVQAIYKRILTDVLERTDGIPEKYLPLLWDNCLASESQDGLVTMLAKAMYQKSDLFLVFEKGAGDIGVIRKADQKEQEQITKDYKEKAESKVGLYITFKNYDRTDMVKIYSGLEYCGVNSLWKTMNLSKAIQLKFKDLRASVGAGDSAEVKEQMVKIAEGLRSGKDVGIDGEDKIETAKPDLTATTTTTEFIDKKRSFYLGMPASYLGLEKTSLNDSGDKESKQIERGLKGYYFPIIKPVIEKLFDSKTSFKSEDFESVSTANETLKTFELTSDEYVSKESKQGIINKMYGLPKEAKGDAPKPTPKPDQAAAPQPAPGAKPTQPAAP